MIVEAIVKLFTTATSAVVTSLPTPVLATIADIEIPAAVKHGAYFFPLDCLFLAISTFLLWYGILISWVTIEWVYKKIPGVN